jgi:hypothetical protein
VGPKFLNIFQSLRRPKHSTTEVVEPEEEKEEEEDAS